MYRHRRLLITLTGLGAASAPVLGMSTTSSAAPPSPAPRVTVLHLSGQAARTLGDGVLTPQHAGSGYARATLAAGSGRRVTVSGPVGSAAVITETQSPDGRDGIRRAVHSDSRRQGARRRPDAKAEAYAASGRSVVVEAMAAGIPYEQAVAEFGDMDPALGAHEGRCAGRPGPDGRKSGTAGESGAATPGGSAGGSGRLHRDRHRWRRLRSCPASSRREGHRSVRLRLRRHLLQRQQYSHACDIRYLDYARNGQWYLSHKMKVSAAYDCFWSALTRRTSPWSTGRAAPPTAGKGTVWTDFDPYTTEPSGAAGRGRQGCRTRRPVRTSPTRAPSAPRASARVDRARPGHLQGYGAMWQGRSSSAKGAVAAGVVNNPSRLDREPERPHPLQLVPEVAAWFAGREPAAPVQGLGRPAGGGPAERGPPMPFRWPPAAPTLRLMDQPHVIVLFGATGDLARRKLLPGLLHLFAGRAAARRAASSAPRSTSSTTTRSATFAREAVRRVRQPHDHRRAVGRRSPASCATCRRRAAPPALRRRGRAEAEARARAASRAGCTTSACRRRPRWPWCTCWPRPGWSSAAGSSWRSRSAPTSRQRRDAERRAARGLRRGADLPDRPLPRQGGGAEHPRVPLRQRPVRADLEPQPHRPRADRRARDARPRAARRRSTRRPAPTATWSSPTCSRCSRSWRWSRRPRSSRAPISEEKNKVFRSMLPIEPHDVVRGQYIGYRDERRASPTTPRPRRSSPSSATIDNWRWAGVPFFLRTGKRMAEGARIISIAFREPPQQHVPARAPASATHGPDHLTFDLADASKMSLSFYGKRPGPGHEARQAEPCSSRCTRPAGPATCSRPTSG